MARLVLVEFDSNAQAEAFVAKIDQSTAAGKKFRVMGMFARPTRWCGCPRPTGYAKDEIVQGGSYGWWVHVLCRRPRMGTHQPHNLLQPRLTDAEITSVVHSVSIAEVPTENIRGRAEHAN